MESNFFLKNTIGHKVNPECNVQFVKKNYIKNLLEDIFGRPYVQLLPFAHFR